MGQYLAISMTTRIAVAKTPIARYAVALPDIIGQMKTSFFFEPDVFDFSEDAEYWIWRLNAQILADQLRPFLHAMYPVLYQGDSPSYQEVLDALEQTPPENWLDIAAARSFAAFQEDPYGEKDRLKLQNIAFHPRTSISYEGILLSLEGKIMMETYGRQFAFFKYCIGQAFHEFPIAQAVRVYISG